MAGYDIKEIVEELKNYDGEEVRIMEVCGTHTAAISENGIPSILSDKIKLISGPGCPVCVTVTAVIDKLIELSMRSDTIVLTFGDLTINEEYRRVYYGDKEINLKEAITEGYSRLVSENIDRSMSHIDIAALIEDKINSMPIDELERLIMSVMKKELNTIISLGALIGIILGLAGNLFP